MGMAPALFPDLTPSTFPTAGSRPATLLRSPTLVRLSTPLPLLVATLPLPPWLPTPSTPLFLPTPSTLPLSTLSTTDLPTVLLPTAALSTTDKQLRKAGC